MPDPFQTHVEGKSYVDLLVDYLSDKPVGYELRYDDPELPFDIKQHRHAVIKARVRMESSRKMTLMAVRGVGYRIVSGIQHVRLAASDGRSGARKIRKALKRAKNADEREMNHIEKLERDTEILKLVDQKRAVDEASYKRMSAQDVIKRSKEEGL